MARKPRDPALSIFQPSGRVVLLGAGATYGADFGFQPLCTPPLNRDFFTQLQRITEKHAALVQAVVGDVIELFGANFSLTLEDYFTQLEFLAISANLTGSAESQRLTGELRAKRDRLMAALSAVLEMSTDRAIRVRSGCRLHKDLVAELAPGDTVISFNYDCVLDDALRRVGDDKWSARWGYCFPKRYVVSGSEHWDADRPAKGLGSTVYLLKLHGSLNWQLPSREGDVITVKQRLHSQRGTPRFTIIPPEWNKAARDEPIFNFLWRRAYRAIAAAERIAIVGFSFTPTDLHVESLFRLALSRSRLRSLVIANPSHDDRTRIRRVFAPALAKNAALVRQYDSFSEMIDAFPACFR